MGRTTPPYGPAPTVQGRTGSRALPGRPVSALGAVAGESDQTGDGAKVLLAVAAAQHVLGEDPVEGDAGGGDGELPVVHAVGEDDQPQGGGLVVDRPDAAQEDGVDVVEHGAVPARVDVLEVFEQGVEVVQRGAGGGG